MQNIKELSNIVELLNYRSIEQPENIAYLFLRDGEEEAGRITYGELDLRARAIAAFLLEQGAAGERVMLLFPSGLDFIAAFFGCLYAGAIAVPSYPPRSGRAQPRLLALATSARPRFTLGDASTIARYGEYKAQIPALAETLWTAVEEIPEGMADSWSKPSLSPEAIAFLQYTSGSTSDPKGVMVTHANLLHNEEVIRTACQHTAKSIFLSWLPMYHDMGLIGSVLQPLYIGAPAILMAPAAFLQRPGRWLRAISKYRAHTSGAPNFAYDLCVRKIPKEERELLDLHSWRVAFNGAEPVRAETLEQFSEAFGPYGFRQTTFFPCYGLAEATLMVSGLRRPEPPPIYAFRDLDHGHAAEVIEGEAGRWLVSCGTPGVDVAVRVVDPESCRECPPERIGEVWVSGPSVAQGYWDRPEESARTFGATLAGMEESRSYLRTGDLGFLRGGELFITGRLKDLIIIRGRNLYPQDIEATAERSHPALRASGAAFSVDMDGEEKLVVVQEVERLAKAPLDEMAEALRQAIVAEHEVEVAEVVLVRTHTVPKTSSGKVQRRACRALYLGGELKLLARSLATPSELTAGLEPAPSRAEILAAQPAERRGLLEDYLGRKVGRPRGTVSSAPLASMGLDSLRILELHQHLEAEFDCALPLSDLFAVPDLAALAELVLARWEEPAPTRSVALVATGEPEGDHPMSHGQEALWLVDRLAPERAAYNLAVAVVWRGLDADLLAENLRNLVSRHPALRTTVAVLDGTPVQRVHPQLDPEFVCEDAWDWETTRLLGRIAEETYRPFDLTRGPLLRVAVFTLAHGEHAVVLVAHHLVADLWSLTVVLQELGTLYGSPTGAGDLPPLRLRYTDAVRWHRQRLAGEEGERLWDYWRLRLAGELPVLDLDGDRPRPAVQTFRGAARHAAWEERLMAGLRGLGRAEGATLSMTLLAGFFFLLYRLTGQEDLLVGTPVAGRESADLAGLVGYFANPVVVRAGLCGEITFIDLLRQVRGSAAEAFEHQGFPLALLVERLHAVRDPSRSPLFQVLFSMQSVPFAGTEGIAALALGQGGAHAVVGPITLETLPIEERRALFDLTLSAAELGGRIALSLQFNTDLFDPTTAERILIHFKVLLDAATADPARPLADLSLLTEVERHQALLEWHATAASIQDTALVSQLFAEQAARTPDAVAVVHAGEAWTYGQLALKTRGLAGHLQRLGVGAEVRVGLCLERSPRMLAGVLAVLTAGGAYVPLDPSYPQERLALMIRDSGVRLVLTESRGAEALADANVPLVHLDRDADVWRGESPAGQVAGPLPESLAYVLYTSGSTGRPKGVEIHHRALANLLDHMGRILTIGPQDVFLSVTTLSFDIGSVEIFLPLITGGRVVLVGRETAADGRALGREIECSAATLTQGTPSSWQLLLEAGWQGSEKLTALCAGEALSAELARRLASRTARLWNLYGPTEATIYSTSHLVVNENGVVPIGRAVANTWVHLLDRNLEPLPVGLAGDLYIGGLGLARGYHERPDLTAAAFVPDPWAAETPGARLYCSGDLARWSPSGEIEYLGRRDTQVKVRGHRIELGEIEASLERHPAVARAAAAVREDRPGDRRLVAYAVLRAGIGAEAGELRVFLKGLLPNPFLPSAIVLLPGLPLTPSGKLDRRGLPAPEGEDSIGTLPRGPVEEMVAALWCEVLGIERVLREDNFFELGGHSLLASRLLARIREAFRVELPLSSVFAAPTVAGLAVRLGQARGGNPAPPLRPVARPAELRLSSAQARLWFLHQMAPGSAVYTIPVEVELTGPLAESVLMAACDALVLRHEALRTVIYRGMNEPVQRVLPSAVPSWSRVDLCALPAALRATVQETLSHEEASRPFDLETGPPVRFALFRTKAERHRLILSVHHLVADGGSVRVLLHELVMLYGALMTGVRINLPEPPLQLGDYVAWEERWIEAGGMESELAYWRRQLADAPAALELPTDRPRPPVESFAGAFWPVTLPTSLVVDLKTLGRRRGGTSFMVFLAGFQVLLCRYTGQESVVVGSPFANTASGLERSVGLFIETMALHTRLVGEPSFLEVLDRARETCLSAHEHQHVSFGRLVEEVQGERDLSRSPLFQSLFVLDDVLAEEACEGLVFRPRLRGTATAKMDLLLYLVGGNEGLAGGLEYATSLFEAATIARLARHFGALLESIAADPERKVEDCPLLAESEQAQLNVEWNDTERSLAGSCRAMHELFELQAESGPERVGLICGGAELRYGEINRRANRVAHLLVGVGAVVGNLVGVLMEPGLETVVALLGVLKSGGAYVPLDPSYPAERLSSMLTDMQLLLTESRWVDLLAGYGGRVICLDSAKAGLARESEENPGLRVASEDLAYVIYTSGSTGHPKGVAIDHGAAVNTLLDINERFGVGEGDRVLALSSLSFDLSVYDLFGLLAAGGAAVLVPSSLRRDPSSWWEQVSRHGVTIWNTVPALAEMFAEHAALCEAGECGLRLVLMSGDWIPLGLPARLRIILGEGVKVASLGGATEGSIWSIFHPIGSVSPDWTSIPYGRPLWNQSFHVFDRSLGPQPIGVVGELYIGGRGVAREYWGDAAKTAASFRPHPRLGGERLYRTGDLGRRLADGAIEFLGRADHQVKIRGFRIELGEIEAVLAGCEGVREALAMVRDDLVGGRGLVAYVVLEEGVAPASERLEEAVRSKLPEYMVPAYWMLLDALPLSANGKVERRALPAPGGGREETRRYIAPRGQVEELLASIYREVLKVDRVGADDSFFGLGGDSILTLQVVARANRVGLRVTSRQIFEQPTLAGLARVAAVPARLRPDPGQLSGPILLAPMQRWFFEQELPNPEHWNQSVLLEASGPRLHLETRLLESALALLVAHHDALHHRFTPPEPGQALWRQTQGDTATGLVEIDLSALPPTSRRSALERAAAALQASLDLAVGPLLRAGLFKLAAEEPDRLLLIIHHLVVDGVSWRILLEDLETSYGQLARGEVAELPPKTLFFQMWTEKLAGYARTTAADAARSYWLESLARPVARLPVELFHGPNHEGTASEVTVSLSEAATRALLLYVPRAYRTQINDVLLAALGEAFASWIGSRRLLLDLEGHGREEIFDDADLSRTVGWFTSQFPVLLDLEGTRTPGEALRAVKEQLRALPHRGLDYGVLRYMGRDEISLARLPRAEVRFNFLGQFDLSAVMKGLFREAGEWTGSERCARQPRSHLLEINCSIRSERLEVTWSYSRNRHRRATIERLATSFLTGLQVLIDHCLMPDVGSFTPTDFALARLEQQELDQVVSAAGGRLDDLFGLSPLQEGMLFHSLQLPRSSAYVEQISFILGRRLDLAAFEQAWQGLVARHSSLRTAFFWRDLDRPLQGVVSEARLDWNRRDLKGLPADEQKRRAAVLMEEDRTRGFDLSVAPLMRLTLIHLGGGIHRFVWTYHHILIDGWSIPILFRDLSSLYEAASGGAKPRFGRIFPYRDYIAWLECHELIAAEEFWRGALRGISAPTPLPVARTADRRAEATPASRQRSFTPAATEALRAFAREHGLTSNTLVQGAWALLLARYSGADDVIFGNVVAGRSAAVEGIDEMVGLFINTLPSRVCVPGETRLLAWLENLQVGQAELRQYEHCPLTRVQGWSEVPRGQPLFESILAFENFPLDESVLATSLVQGEVDVVEQTHYPLAIVAVPMPQLRIKALYDSRLFDTAVSSRLLGHLEGLLLGMLAASSGEPLSGLSMLSEAERHQLRMEWNDTGRSLVGSCRAMHELFELQAESGPERVSLICGGTELRYGELNRRSNRIAHLLVGGGLVPGSLVGVLMEPGLETVVALLGVLKTGGAYVPLDPSYPTDRLSAMLTDVPVLLTESRWVDPLPAFGGRVIRLDSVGAELARQSEENPGLRVTSEDLAYVIYTSGSTGRPKGVAIDHGAAVNTLLDINERFGVGEADRVLALSALSFDLSVYDLFGLLAAGGAAVLVPSSLRRDPSSWWKLASRYGVTIWNTVPALAEMFAEQAALSGAGECGLRLVLMSGDWIPLGLPDRLRALGEGMEVVSLGGATEGSIWSIFHPIGLVSPDWTSIPYGRPLWNQSFHVLDRSYEPPPIGAVGELYIGGRGVAREYWGDAEKTAASFRPHPGLYGERLYRTGDLGRRLADGTIEFMGRTDHQVKIRGYRIELGEIEAVLSGCQGVREALVMVREDLVGGRGLVAYVVPEEGVAPAPERLQEAVLGKVPEYMIPAHWVLLDALPLTDNGKVDRRSLPAPDRSREEKRRYLAPRSPIEGVVAGIWEELLGCERVGMDDDFFALGGHSLVATQVVSRLSKVSGVDLPVRVLFDAPTVAELAQAVEEKLQGGARGQVPPILPVPRHGPLPLSFAQQRLWFLDRLSPENAVYNIPGALRLRGELDGPMLERSMTEILRRHESLRTTFHEVGGVPVQVVVAPLPLPLPLVDLAGLFIEDRDEEVRRLHNEAARWPFAIARGPLVRTLRIRLSPNEHLISVVMHHIVTDGWSMSVLMEELGALYGAYALGRPSPLSELPIQYCDYAAWQRSWLAGEVLEGQLAYWRGRLAGAPALLALPGDRPRAAVQSFRGGRLAARPLAESLRNLARRHGVTSFMVVVAGVASLLLRLTGQEDLSIGSPIAGRRQPETENLIGFFVNTLVLRMKLEGDLSFSKLVERVREVCLGAYAHQDLPFERLVEELSPVRSLAHSPLFQVMVSQNTLPGRQAFPGLVLESVELASGLAKFDLSLNLEERPAGLCGWWEYSTYLFDRSTIGRLAIQFDNLLRDIAEGEDKVIGSLALLSPGEFHQVSVEWNDTRTAIVSGVALHHLFEAQVARTPSARAVSFSGEHLTYAGLDEQANRLAHRLVALGVGPEVLVGICAERSLEMVVGLLAILKAGGAYVPLDPEHPRDRLAAVLEDARIAILLTQERLLPRLPESGAATLLLDGPKGEDGAGLVSPPIVAVAAENLAYVIFTSGSTGRPKGAMNTHGAVLNRVVWMQAAYGLTVMDGVLQKTPFGFDVSVWEFFWPLAVGARLVMAQPGGHQDPGYLVETIAQDQITTLHFVPSMLHVFLEVQGLESCRTLCRVIASGEALSADLVARFAKRLPGVQLHNLYGPTEAAIDVTSWACRLEDGGRSVPIGRPIANLRTHLLDAALVPVPQGAAGELYIGGIGLARGYVYRPALTAERFLPEPFDFAPGARMYRTGDLARQRADGAIECLGRVDNQVKIRGFRIELGEIEAVLGSHPRVRESVVVAREESGAPRLIAYFVPREEGAQEKFTTADLALYLGTALPAYMVPSVFVRLSALPQNANGKVDRRSLPAPDPEREGAAFATPRSSVEEVLCEIWADVLGLPKVSIHDNFFGLGGHSLLAPRIVLRLRQVFGVDVPVRSLFQQPTVAGLAGVVSVARGQGEATEPLVRSVQKGVPQPLSHAQLRFWMRRGEGAAANSPVGVRLRGRIDISALERALNEIARRHEALRVSFLEIDGEPVQVIREDFRLSMPVVDLAALPVVHREQELLYLAAFAGRHPFDLAGEPLVRASLIRVDAAEYALFLIRHHLITDGWSDGVFWDELAMLYSAFVRGERSPLPELPIQYGDYTAWQRSYLRSRGDELLRYWREQLRDLEVLFIPTDHERPALRSVRGGSRRLALNEGISKRVREFGRRENASLFMTLLAAWKACLFLWTGQEDVSLATNIANRNRPETERLIGLFTNVLILRTSLTGDPTFRELLCRVREATIEAFAHQELPFVEILSLLRAKWPDRSNYGYNDFFPVGFVLQNIPLRPLALPGVAVESFDLSSGTSPRDLILVGTGGEAELQFVLLYREDIFEPSTIESLLANYERLLEFMVDDPERCLSTPAALFARLEVEA